MTLHQAPTQDVVSPTTIMGTVKLAIDVLKMTILKVIIDAMQDRQDVTTWMTWASLKHVTVEMLCLQAMMSMMKSIDKSAGTITIAMKRMRRHQTKNSSKANLTAPTTIKSNQDVTTVFTHDMIIKVEEKQTMQMRMIQVLVMMKNTHMRGAIAMRNHITIIVNQ